MRRLQWLALLVVLLPLRSASADTAFGDIAPATSMKTAADVVAYAQPIDADLTALAGVTSAADRVPYFTGSGTATVATFTAAGRSMVGAADAAAQTALLSAMVGDSGSGGTKGLVPAPAAGDAAAGKFLKADGTFAVPTGSSGAPSTAKYYTLAADGTLSAEILLDVAHCRLEFNTTSTIILNAYEGHTITVNGEAVDLASAISCAKTDNRITSTGADAGAALSNSTLYYAYVSNSAASAFALDLRLSTVAPTLVSTSGLHYLGSSGNEANWRYVGMARTDASGNFASSLTQRFVISHFNKQPLHLYSAPGYQDDSTIDSWTAGNTTWAAANGGTGSKIEWLVDIVEASSFRLPVYVWAVATAANSGANNNRIGIGIDSTTNAKASATCTGTTAGTIACHWFDLLSAGYHAADLLVAVSAGTGTYFVDIDDLGGSDDSAAVYIAAWIMG